MRELSEHEIEQVVGGIAVSESSHAKFRGDKNAVKSIYHSVLPCLNTILREATACSACQIHKKLNLVSRFNSTLKLHL
jgi:hypothetical protein